MTVSAGTFGSETAPHTQCTAMSRRSGKQCRGIAMLNSIGQKCRMHGGQAQHAIGASNSQFKDGRHSKYLPSKLDELYREARSNPDLLDMAENIALLEARIKLIFQDTIEGDPVPKWGEVKEAFATIETALLGGNSDECITGMEKMHAILDAGDKWDRTWNQVMETMEQLRKLTDTDVKRKKELNQMVPVERVVILMAAVGSAVKRNVKDPAEIAAVYRELAMLHGSDRVPGNPSETRVGPEFIDVRPRTSRTKRLREAAAEEVDAAT